MQAMFLAQRLGRQAMDASTAAWAVEMRLRALRFAETEEKKETAIASLNDIVYKYDLAIAAE
jgi:hypothetical protein